jgi:uncharacterized protein HemX
MSLGRGSACAAGERWAKRGQGAGKPNSSAIWSTEDAAPRSARRRQTCAQSAAPGSRLIPMSLDGLRAWIGLVERKLTMRTRVFLVLVAIAIGGAAVGIYLGASAQSNQVTEDDLQAVQDELQREIEGVQSQAPGGLTEESSAQLTALESEIRALQARVEKLEGKTGTSQGEGTSGGGTESNGKKAQGEK